MTLDDWKTNVDIVESAAKVIGILIAGFWAIRLYIRNSENNPHVEFDLDIVFLKKVDKYWITEITANFDNKGKVRHIFSNLTFNIHGITANDPILRNVEYSEQVSFPHEILNGALLPIKQKLLLVEPGVKFSFAYIINIPDDMEVIKVHSYWMYDKTKDMHAAQRAFAVPK
jgi:hypothetical protein